MKKKRMLPYGNAGLIRVKLFLQKKSHSAEKATLGSLNASFKPKRYMKLKRVPGLCVLFPFPQAAASSLKYHYVCTLSHSPSTIIVQH